MLAVSFSSSSAGGTYMFFLIYSMLGGSISILLAAIHEDTRKTARKMDIEPPSME
jgi:hypothetical protein